MTLNSARVCNGKRDVGNGNTVVRHRRAGKRSPFSARVLFNQVSAGWQKRTAVERAADLMTADDKLHADEGGSWSSLSRPAGDAECRRRIGAGTKAADRGGRGDAGAAPVNAANR